MSLEQFLALFGMPREAAESLIARLREKYPDTAPVLDEVLAEIASYVTTAGLVERVKEALSQFLDALEKGKGPVDPGPEEAF